MHLSSSPDQKPQTTCTSLATMHMHMPFMQTCMCAVHLLSPLPCLDVHRRPPLPTQKMQCHVHGHTQTLR